MDISALHATYPSLYGKEYIEKDMDSRFLSLVEAHRNLFGSTSPMLFSSSGRTEIAGNHTDHNLGKVIGATVNLDTIAAVSLNDDNKIRLLSEGFTEAVINVDELEMREEEKNSSISLLRGIAATFKKRGYRIGGFNANTTTRVLRGSGLSSSAAIEVLIGEILNSLFNDDTIQTEEIAKIGQIAENTYFGKPSGLLDQICSAHGGIVGIDFKDNDNPIITPVQIDFNDFGYNMIITDTKGSHADLTDEYASIPPDMRSVAKYFGKKNLREVEYESFINNIPSLREYIKNDRAILRAYHFFKENDRVSKMIQELKDNKIDSFLKNVRDSGLSSFRFLQNVYPSSMPKTQGLSVALALSEEILSAEGATRVHGGGFAGTIQAYVPERLTAEYTERMERVFGLGACTRIAIRTKPVCRIL